MINTVFIKPNSKEKQYQGLKPISAIEPPLWMAIIANTVDHPVLIDAEAEDLNYDEVNNKIADNSKIIIMATGSHPSAHIQQKDAADKLSAFLVCHGYKDIQIYDHLPHNPIDLGYPRWDLLPMKKYRAHNWHTWGRYNKKYGITYTSISCPFNCNFCCVKDFYRSEYRKRDPLDATSDIYFQYSKYGITNFKIMDEIFATDTQHTRDFCNYLISFGFGDELNIWAYARIDTVTPKLLKLMRKAGITWLGYGIESGNEIIRQNNGKGKISNYKIKNVIKMTRDAGINVAANYMFGFEDDDWETMRQTLDFAIELNTEYANFYCVVAYPGSELYKRANIKREPIEYAQLSYEFNPMPTRYLKPAQVLMFRDYAFDMYFRQSPYLDMMKKKFGEKAVKEIKEMSSISIRRKIYER